MTVTFKPPRLHKPLAPSGAIQLPNTPTHGNVIEKVHVTYQGYWAAVIDHNKPSTRDVMRDVRIECLPPRTPTDTNTMSKWGVRRYKVSGIRERLHVSGVWKEHAAYESPGDAGLTYQDCFFEDCGAQGLQARHTGNRADPSWNMPRAIMLRRVACSECGQARGVGRAGFSVSIKDMGPLTDVTFEDLRVRTIKQSAVKVSGNKVYDSFGAVCVEYCRSLHWHGGYVEMRNPDRSPVQLFDFGRNEARRTGPDFIELRRVHIANGGNIAVRKCGSRIDIRNCTGDGRVLVYDWNGSAWKLAESHPIAGGYTWSR
jgi:hypothetical protein